MAYVKEKVWHFEATITDVESASRLTDLLVKADCTQFSSSRRIEQRWEPETDSPSPSVMSGNDEIAAAVDGVLDHRRSAQFDADFVNQVGDAAGLSPTQAAYVGGTLAHETARKYPKGPLQRMFMEHWKVGDIFTFEAATKWMRKNKCSHSSTFVKRFLSILVGQGYLEVCHSYAWRVL